MLLTNHFDSAEEARMRAQQADPLVMYLVVRRERVTDLSSLLVAVAQATVRADRLARASATWAERAAAWHAGSFRKVTLRANERDWAKLRTTYEAAANVGRDEDAALVVALPPRYRSEADKFLRGLQAYTLALDELPRGILPSPTATTLVVAVNPEVLMSVGKLCAQVGHAALMCVDAPAELQAGAVWAAAVQAWWTEGLSVLPLFPKAVDWQAIGTVFDGVVVTDAGLTEIAAGSQTVLALRPTVSTELQRVLQALALGAGKGDA
jgi:peptidyl-tRNA hydrolase